MCERVTGAKIKLEELWAWKRFKKLTKTTWSGPYYGENLPRGRWLSTRLKLSNGETVRGFHVVVKRNTWRDWLTGVRRRVRIKGYAYPFENGYAVTSIFVPLPRRRKRVKV